MSYIKIFNPKSNHEILLDTSVSGVIFHPRNYEDKPYFEIKLLNGFNFIKHAAGCEDCGSFYGSLGKNTVDWYLEYEGKTYRLNLEDLGSETKVTYKNSFYEYGTIIKLAVHDIPVELNELLKLKDKLVSNEEFEKACIIRDLINEK